MPLSLIPNTRKQQESAVARIGYETDSTLHFGKTNEAKEDAFSVEDSDAESSNNNAGATLEIDDEAKKNKHSSVKEDDNCSVKEDAQSTNGDVLDVHIGSLEEKEADDELESMMSTNSLKELRARCKELDLSQAGKKVDLAKRIIDKTSAVNERDACDDDGSDILIS